MSLIKSLQKKLFGKSKTKSPATSSTNSGSAVLNFSFESDLLKKDLSGLDTLSKEELADLLKRYASDYVGYSTMCKDYLGKVDEKLEEAKKQVGEFEALKLHYEKLQEQQKQMVAENDATISSNNELKSRVAELQKLNGEKGTLVDQSKLIEQLKADIKKKDKIIVEYDEKFELLEEKTQTAIGKQRSTQSKASTLDEQLAKLQREIDEQRKENETLQLCRQREASAISQERVEFKKAISVLEMHVAHLAKEKTESEHFPTSKFLVRADRAANAKKPLLHTKETQTENLAMPSTSIKGSEEEMIKLREYAASLKEELSLAREKISSGNVRTEELQRMLSEKEGLGAEVKRLLAENADLKKRREAAVVEINKLTQQLLKKGSSFRIGEATPSGNSATGSMTAIKEGKVIRHMSEAVISTKDSKGPRAMTGEQEIILSTKKELELLYKDFIRCVFRDTPSISDKAEVQRLAGSIDARFNGIIEKLSDYCDEQLEPVVRASCLVAKLKKEHVVAHTKGPEKLTVAFMPPAPKPEQSFAKRVAEGLGKAPVQSPVKSGETKKPSPTHTFPANGPVKLLLGPVRSGK